MSQISCYEDLIVWKKAMMLVKEVYKLTEKYPREEIYGLISQSRRSAVSIPSNIAEGSRRGSKKDFRHFLLNAFGSGAELETQIRIAMMLEFIKNDEAKKAYGLLQEVMKMLNKMTSNMKS